MILCYLYAAVVLLCFCFYGVIIWSWLFHPFTSPTRSELRPMPKRRSSSVKEEYL